MRRRNTLAGEQKIQDCCRRFFVVKSRQIPKLLFAVILLTKIQGTNGITVGNGNVFTGDVRESKPQGNGTLTAANGDKYTGYFEDGKMSGELLVEYNNGDFYRGEVNEDGIREGKGVYNFANGNKFTGYFEAGKMSGEFLEEYNDGDYYIGDVDENGIREGKGVYNFANREKYTGYFKNGKMIGRFVVEYPSGNVYTGDVNDYGIRDGKGVFNLANGNNYTGYFEGGKMRGQFLVEYENGDVYRGHVDEDGFKIGKGVYNFASGNKYDGQWKDGALDGHGVYTWSNGDIYIGDFKDGIRHGQGVFTWFIGTTYEGEWRGGVKQGKGVETWSNGDVFEGEYKQDKKNGWGRYIFKTNKIWAEYDGEMIDDDFTGYGKMFYKDKSIYNGQWSSGKREREGLLLWPNGTCFYGQMKNDEIYHGMTMTSDLVFTYPPYQYTTYNGKRFKVDNFTNGEIECFQEEKEISCYNKPNEIYEVYLSGFDHYYIGDTISFRKRKIRDGFGEYAVDGGYYIGEWKQNTQNGFGLKTEPYLPTVVGTFENGILEGLGASIAYSSKQRTVYIGGYMKGQPFGPGIFIYPDGERVLGFFIEGKLDHTANPIYLHPDGSRDSLVPTSG